MLTIKEKSLAKQVVSESRDIELDKSSYSNTVNVHIARDQCSETLLNFLSEINPKLDGTLSALLIGNMMTNAVRNAPTTLQVALGVMAREKYLITLSTIFL